ncbi:fimbrillin family protein [Porphyromonas crevioricanis]|nr:fimbrillin family protein [Porphyromonas crevioricanis]
MKTKLLHLVAVGALMLSACSQDEVLNPLDKAPVAMTFTADISSQLRTNTRVSGTAFEQNDAVGIVACVLDDSGTETTDLTQLNCKYVYDGTRFSSESPYYFRNLQEVKFKAYYPYRSNAELNSERKFVIHADATHQTSVWQRRNDILYAEAAPTSVRRPQVAFSGENHAFKHLMSQMTIEFRAGDGIPDLSLLSGYTLKGLYLTGTYEIGTRDILADTGISRADLRMSVTGTATPSLSAAPVLLIPQPCSGNRLSLEVTYDGQVYKADLDPRTYTMASAILMKGYHYTFTVTVSKTGLSVGEVQIRDWTVIPGIPATATL